MNRAKLRLSVLNDVSKERDRQNRKWGPQRHDYKTWLTILVEEVGEVAQAMQSEMGWGKPTDANNLYEELIHVAAVSVAIAEQIKELEN
ncbi:MazG-like family protein [Caldifermentibacillus hisashii]|jgi:NTP pyrophosphatase (non-canonical NTP hydrolase)|uniref:MazG-like family protein n=1 Tax=Caldifermentibacillus hisashii TaxID=996558 RepID=UPI0031FD866D